MKKFTVVLSIDNTNPVYHVEAEGPHAAFVAAAKEDYRKDFGDLEDFDLSDYGSVAVFSGELENLYCDVI